jgi:hypothetical protein
MAEQDLNPVVDDDRLDAEFDWSPLGRAKWAELGKLAKCRRAQVRFCAAVYRGALPVEAQRLAGYSAPNENAARVSAYRLEQAKGTKRLLALVAGGGGRDGVLSENESKMILTELSRTGDAQARIAAIKTLRSIDSETREREAQERARSADEAFPAVLELCPDFGVAFLAECYLRRHGGLPFGSAEFRRVGTIIPHSFWDIWEEWKQRLAGHDLEIAALETGPLPEGWLEDDEPAAPALEAPPEAVEEPMQDALEEELAVPQEAAE